MRTREEAYSKTIRVLSTRDLYPFITLTTPFWLQSWISGGFQFENLIFKQFGKAETNVQLTGAIGMDLDLLCSTKEQELFRLFLFLKLYINFIEIVTTVIYSCITMSPHYI